jgi:hypothetical protein
MALLVVPLANHLATCPNPYVVRTGWSDTVEYDKLVDIMAAGRTTLTKPDIAGCLELFTEEVAKLVADGRRVKTKLGTFYLCASGKLDARDQSFTPGEGQGSHALKLHFKPDREFEAGICAGVELARGKRYDRCTPTIDSAVSVKSDAEMSAGPGDFLRVEGEKLKFDKANAAEGLFFVNGQETRAVQYARIQPSLLIAQVPPELGPGSYSLVVRSMQGTKELHEGRAAKPFVVSG